MSEDLFKYALSISQELDKTFGKKTIAAKMTDVPGHTKAIIPHMKNAGIEFLHIGVNPASAVPKVPALFRWQADNGDKINVMYNAAYGEFSKIGDTGTAVYFAHTGDNNGIEGGSCCYRRFEPKQAAVYPIGDKLLVRYSFDADAHRKCGCPLLFDVVISAYENTVSFD